MVPRQPTPEIAADRVPASVAPAHRGSAAEDVGAVDDITAGPATLDAEPSLDAELAPDDPSSDEAALDPADGAVPYPSERREDASVGLGGLSPAPVAADAAGVESDDRDSGDSGDSEAPGGQQASDDEDQADADMPVFHRMWSSPVPPGPDS